MEPGVILQIILVGVGILVLGFTVISLAKSRMTEPFCLTWGLFAVIMILAGILLRPAGWDEYLSPTGLILLVLVGLCILYGVYFMTCRISELMRKTNEMAIQISLLKAENEELQKRMEETEQRLQKEQL